VTSGWRRSVWPMLGGVALSVWSSAADADVKSCLDAAEDGQKLRDSGAYRRARERFIACAADECPGEVRKGCVGWLGQLDKLIPTLVFGAHAHGKEVADVRVAIDGEVVTEKIDGKPVALDPGEHHFRFERSGETAIDETAVVLAGEKERLMSVRFGDDPSVLPPSSLPVAPSNTGAPAGAPHAPERQDMRGAAYALGALGLASLASGAVLDISGYAFLQQCSGDASCSGAHERAEVEWRFVTGDVLLGAGVLCGVAAWLLWPRGARVATSPSALIAIDRFAPRVALGLTTVF
jgi:hypothetical protein